MSWIIRKDKDHSSQPETQYESLESIRSRCDEYVLELDKLKNSPLEFFNKLFQRYFFKNKEISSQIKEISLLEQQIKDKEKEFNELELKIEKWWNGLTQEEQFERIMKHYGNEPWEQLQDSKV